MTFNDLHHVLLGANEDGLLEKIDSFIGENYVSGFCSAVQILAEKERNDAHTSNRPFHPKVPFQQSELKLITKESNDMKTLPNVELGKRVSQYIQLRTAIAELEAKHKAELASFKAI